MLFIILFIILINFIVVVKTSRIVIISSTLNLMLKFIVIATVKVINCYFKVN